MRTASIVKHDELIEEGLQSALVDRNQVVEAFAAEYPQTKPLQFAINLSRKDWVAIMKQGN